jgi:hypothetical protein
MGTPPMAVNFHAFFRAVTALQNQGSPWCALLLLLLVLQPEFTEAAPPVAGSVLQERLSQQVSWSARETPFGQLLNDFADDAGICVLRHRLLDPRQPVTLDSGFISRSRVLQQIAAAVPDTAAIESSHFVMLGPRQQVLRIPVLLQLAEQQELEWKRLSSGQIPRSATAALPRQWSTPATPTSILASAAEQGAVRITNLTQLPHDIWSGQSLPPLSFSQLAALVLAQFDLYAEHNPRRAEVTIRPLDPETPLTLRHKVARELQQPLLERLADAGVVRLSGGFIIATGTIDQQAELLNELRRLQSQDTAVVASTDSLRTRSFQLQAARARLGDVVATLRANGVQIVIANEQTADVTRLLQTIVSLEDVQTRQPGEKFFPAIFGKHFGTVEVLASEVRLQP